MPPCAARVVLVRAGVPRLSDRARHRWRNRCSPTCPARTPCRQRFRLTRPAREFRGAPVRINTARRSDQPLPLPNAWIPAFAGMTHGKAAKFLPLSMPSAPNMHPCTARALLVRAGEHRLSDRARHRWLNRCSAALPRPNVLHATIQPYEAREGVSRLVCLDQQGPHADQTKKTRK
jgi:hypothetical protein